MVTTLRPGAADGIGTAMQAFESRPTRAASGRLRAASGRCPDGSRRRPDGSGRFQMAFSRTLWNWCYKCWFTPKKLVYTVGCCYSVLLQASDSWWFYIHWFLLSVDCSTLKGLCSCSSLAPCWRMSSITAAKFTVNKEVVFNSHCYIWSELKKTVVSFQFCIKS